ncbi:Cysteine and glycine-rich protein 1 [Kappamyces sp. JEL0680]|nr:Cysteine and glycine-rich protein 1 [Kappamyces sp. JEL0680]
MPKSLQSSATSLNAADSSGASKTGSSGHLAGTPSGSANDLARQYAGTDICPVCQKKVYFAEQALGPGGIKYHKLCFKCSVCKKQVDSSSLCEKDNVLYCRGDYQKLFGPKGTRSGHMN